jgi:hypothetical protein
LGVDGTGTACVQPPFPSPPSTSSPLAKGTRKAAKRQCEAELLGAGEGETELCLSSLNTSSSPRQPLPSSSPLLSSWLSTPLPAPLPHAGGSPLASPELEPLTTPVQLLPQVLLKSPSTQTASPTHHLRLLHLYQHHIYIVSAPPTPQPMSVQFPTAPFKVICRLCFRDSHNICYIQGDGSIDLRVDRSTKLF